MLDIATLYSVVAAIAVFGSALVVYFSTQRRDAAGALAWAIGIGCVALFFAASVRRAYASPFVSFTLGNGVAIAGLGFMHTGACQITRRRCPLWMHWAASLVASAIIALYLEDPEGGYRGRVALVGGISALQSAAIAWTLWRPDPGLGDGELFARRLSVGVFGMLGLLQFVRMAQHLPFVPSVDTSFLDGTAMARVTAATFFAICLALPFLVVFMHEARTRHALRQTVGELQHALAEVTTLRGLIPICESCRRIRDTNDTWHSIERYLSDHTDVQLSHGVCPDCMRKLYPEYAEEILNQPRK